MWRVRLAPSGYETLDCPDRFKPPEMVKRFPGAQESPLTVSGGIPAYHEDVIIIT